MLIKFIGYSPEGKKVEYGSDSFENYIVRYNSVSIEEIKHSSSICLYSSKHTEDDVFNEIILLYKDKQDIVYTASPAYIMNDQGKTTSIIKS